jgi:hypothetical protein
MKIPKSITVNTGEDAEVRKNIERFLLEAKSEIEKRVGTENSPSRFRTDVKQLCKIVVGNPLPSDELVHMLYYRERVVAVVFETRTDSNYIHFDYTLFPEFF